jgi:hypothetical protein
MYLFSRTRRLTGGNPQKAMAWSMTITEHASQTIGLPINLYVHTMSPDVGTTVAGLVAPDLATLDVAFDKLAADSAYMELVEKGHEFMLPGSTQDLLAQVIYPESFAPDPNRPTDYVVAVQSTIAAGHGARGLAAGVEAAQRAEALTGASVLFLGGVTGNYGGVGWLLLYPDAAAMDRGQTALAGDPGFIEFVDSLEGVFADTPGATTQTIIRRVI